jgi:hypothetical protein
MFLEFRSQRFFGSKTLKTRDAAQNNGSHALNSVNGEGGECVNICNEHDSRWRIGAIIFDRSGMYI